MQLDYEEYSTRLFATLINWINVAFVAVVLANSYYLLVDFWPTLMQNSLGLAVVAVGLLCLRWARRGKPEIAVRIYLVVMILCVGLLTAILSTPFLLNGVIGLSLALMLATSLDSPRWALRWGFLSIVAYVGGLTIRSLTQTGGLGLTLPDTVTMYLLPSVALLGIAVLGRNAKGRLREALDASEMARQELQKSALALQEAQASLEIANEDLRAELHERHRAEQALQASLDETARGQRLVLALSRAAQAMHGARSAEQIYHSLGRGLEELGRGAMVLRTDGSDQRLQIVHVTYNADTLTMLETGLGFPLLGHSVEIQPGGRLQQMIKSGAIVTTQRIGEFVREALPPSLKPLADPLLDELGAKRTVLAPLVAGDEVHGCFAIGASGLSQIEEQAVSTFANQASVALSNVRYLQETQSWASALEHRVQERTAALAASEARYRRLFDSSRDAIYILDLRGNFIDANPSGCELSGYGREELLALHAVQLDAQAQDLTTEAQRQLWTEMLAGWQDGVSGAEAELQPKGGRKIPIEVTITPLDFQGREALLATVRDVSVRKKAEAELHQSQAEALQHHQRLLDLSQAAQAVQRARTTEEVHQIVGHEVDRLGFKAVVLSTTPKAGYLRVSHTTFEPRLLCAAERITGMSTRSIRIRLESDGRVKRIIDAGESVYFKETAERLALGVPELSHSTIDRVVALLGIEKTVFAPLLVGGKLHGILMVAGTELQASDVPAFAVLGNQAGIAIENAELLEEQRANQARMQQLARQLVSAQEDERRRLSHALHDEAGQALTALKINLELIAQDLAPQERPLRERLGNAVAMVDATMDDIRQLAQGLRPPALDTVGLGATLAGFCSDFARRTQLRVNYEGQEVPRLPEPVSITLYRFLQEALTNVARHAKAERVRVALVQDAEAIRLTVEDDGQGFAVQRESSPENGPGMGLAGMWDRLQSLDGYLETDSQPGIGTRLTAHIPL
jgi:PAS domain S-box-containing protein